MQGTFLFEIIFKRECGFPTNLGFNCQHKGYDNDEERSIMVMMIELNSLSVLYSILYFIIVPDVVPIT